MLSLPAAVISGLRWYNGGTYTVMQHLSQSDAFEAHVYPEAGYIFSDDPAQFGTGWEIMLGGTVDGEAAAFADSEDILFNRLASWHGSM